LVTRRLELHGSLEGLNAVFRGLLDDAGFIIMDEDELGEGFRILAVNRKRTSLMTSTLMSTFTGHIPRRRFALELTAHESGENLTTTLKCTPYIDSVDLEAVAESLEEIERCKKLLGLFGDRIVELMGSGEAPG